MSIQMLEEGLLNNDIKKAIEGFNNMFGKELPVPTKAKKGDTAKLKSTAKALASIIYSLEEIVSDMGKASVKKKKLASTKKELDIMVEEAEEEPKKEMVNEEDSEEKEFEDLDSAEDLDGNKFNVISVEQEEKPIFRGSTIKTKFVTNEMTKEEAKENENRQVTKKKPSKNLLHECENPKCKNLTTNIYTRKGDSRILCPKCEKKEILG